MAMTIEELKKALVEVSELCAGNTCASCPLHYVEIDEVPECPLCVSTMMLPPEHWAKSKLQERSYDKQT